MILIDFGLAKYFNIEELMQSKVGTSYYIAPEVLDGNYNNKCDNWSLGVLLFVLLTGTVPFDGKTD